MDDRERAQLLAGFRVAAGTALMLAPTLATRLWIGPSASGSGARVLARTLGIRDLVLGAGVLLAMRRDAPVQGWLEAGLAADLVDLLAVGLTAEDASLAGRLGVVGVAGAAAVEGGRLARALD